MQCMHSVFTIEWFSTDENHPEFIFILFLFFRIIFWFIGFIFNSFKSFNKPTMLIKFIVLIYFNSSWGSRSFPLIWSKLSIPYKYKNHLFIFFIQKTLFYRKFSIISLFLETHPKSLLSIPLDSLKREDSRTFFRSPFHLHTRSHAPP